MICDEKNETYALIRASTHVVRQTSTIMWVTHEDTGLNSGKSSTCKSGASATAKSIIHNLATLAIGQYRAANAF